MKSYLQTPLVPTPPMTDDILSLYLGVTDFAISGIFFKVHIVEKSIHYVSKTLQPVEVRYTPIEKVTFALVIVAKNVSATFKHTR